MSDRWRGVVAALLNPDLRAALAELSAEVRLTDAGRARALARLEELGLARRDGEKWVFDDAAARGILSESARVKPTGVERFLDADGRIDRYPVRDGERRELLVWVADRAVATHDVLSERDLNERLEPYAPGGDVAVLRRYLIDHGLLERTRSGSEYARVSEPARAD